MRYGRRIVALISTVALMCALTACSNAAAMEGTPDGPTISIGVAVDEPGMSWLHDGVYSGFDITVARYVANALGYADKQIEFTSMTPHSGEQLLKGGKADLLVSALPMDTDTLSSAEYAGPYLVTDQQLLIRRENRSGASSLSALAGKVVCTARGSGADVNLASAIPGAIIKPRDSYPQCLTALMIGEADAVSADGALIAGLAHTYGQGYLSIVHQPIARAEHGVRVRDGNTQLTDKVDEALRAMRRDGSWERAVKTLRHDTGFVVDQRLNAATFANHR